MKAEYVNPFITATLNALETIAAVKPTMGKPFVKGTAKTSGDISGIIGLAGQARGSVAVTFPSALALHIYAQMVGEELDSLSEEVRDAVGELVNLVAGGAKGILSRQGYDFKISIPSVVVGKCHSVDHKGSVPCLVVPFELGEYSFWLEVSFDPRNNQAS